jgi:hypothetical protein
MCILSDATPFRTPAAHTPAARLLPPPQRQRLAVQALAGTRPIAQLAHDHDVSRKFVYQQVAKAEHALDNAFTTPDADADRVLFHLPVTKAWLQQLTLGLILICHSSYRGVVELYRDLFDSALCVGTVHNFVHRVIPLARRRNDSYDLQRVRLGAHDEIFQADSPVLVGVDVASTFCYLLSQEEHRDADTWGVRLLELQGHGFAPDATIADFATGLRAGQKQAFPEVPCRGDVFHVLHKLLPVVTFLENRAYAAMAARSKLEQQQASHERRQGRKNLVLVPQVRAAWQAETQAIALAGDVALLAQWLRKDILAVAGADSADRAELYDFVVAELGQRVPLCDHRLRSVWTLLKNQRNQLLAFVVALESELVGLAATQQIPVAVAWAMLNTQAQSVWDQTRWQRDGELHKQLGAKYHAVSVAVADIRSRVVRASSVIENLNSRLRGYFFLRRELGSDYLALLQFFLNHRRFLRSEHAERADRSPAELLTGQEHAHWLELLGFTRFVRQ